MMREMLDRRFSRARWPLPALVLVDGGLGQVNVAKKVLDEKGLRIPVVGIAKGPKRKRNDMIGLLPRDIKTLGLSLNDLVRIRDEAHRFAVKYHTYLRGKGMIAKF